MYDVYQLCMVTCVLDGFFMRILLLLCISNRSLNTGCIMGKMKMPQHYMRILLHEHLKVYVHLYAPGDDSPHGGILLLLCLYVCMYVCPSSVKVFG